MSGIASLIQTEAYIHTTTRVWTSDQKMKLEAAGRFLALTLYVLDRNARPLISLGMPIAVH